VRKSRENPLEKILSIVIRFVVLRKSSGFGVFAEISSKNIVIPSKEIPFFGETHQRFWAIIAKFGFFGVLRMAQIAKFGYSGDPNNRIFTRINEFVIFGWHPNNRIFG
jgi:hypothetical protein